MTTESMNVNDLRSILAEEIHKLRKEETTPENVKAISNAAGKILTTIKMEMEYAKMLGITPQIDFIQIKSAKHKKLLKESDDEGKSKKDKGKEK